MKYCTDSTRCYVLPKYRTFSRYTRYVISFYASKKSTAFPKPSFTKLANDRHHYVQNVTNVGQEMSSAKEEIHLHPYAWFFTVPIITELTVTIQTVWTSAVPDVKQFG